MARQELGETRKKNQGIPNQIYFIPKIVITAARMRSWWSNQWVPKLQAEQSSLQINSDISSTMSRADMINVLSNKEQFTDLVKYIKDTYGTYKQDSTSDCSNNPTPPPSDTIEFLQELYFPTPVMGLTTFQPGGLINIPSSKFSKSQSQGTKQYRVDSVTYKECSYQYCKDSGSSSETSGCKLVHTGKSSSSSSNNKIIKYTAAFYITLIRSDLGESRAAVCDARGEKLKQDASDIFGASLIYGDETQRDVASEQSRLDKQGTISIKKPAVVQFQPDTEKTRYTTPEMRDEERRLRNIRTGYDSRYNNRDILLQRQLNAQQRERERGQQQAVALAKAQQAQAEALAQQARQRTPTARLVPGAAAAPAPAPAPAAAAAPAPARPRCLPCRTQCSIYTKTTGTNCASTAYSLATPVRSSPVPLALPVGSNNNAIPLYGLQIPLYDLQLLLYDLQIPLYGLQIPLYDLLYLAH